MAGYIDVLSQIRDFVIEQRVIFESLICDLANPGQENDSARLSDTISRFSNANKRFSVSLNLVRPFAVPNESAVLLSCETNWSRTNLYKQNMDMIKWFHNLKYIYQLNSGYLNAKKNHSIKQSFINDNSRFTIMDIAFIIINHIKMKTDIEDKFDITLDPSNSFMTIKIHTEYIMVCIINVTHEMDLIDLSIYSIDEFEEMKNKSMSFLNPSKFIIFRNLTKQVKAQYNLLQYEKDPRLKCEKFIHFLQNYTSRLFKKPCSICKLHLCEGIPPIYQDPSTAYNRITCHDKCSIELQRDKDTI
ncbi:MAG: Mediator of RNA polymerase II transcription subunit 27 [Marteilia pararefringens]